MNDLLTQIKIDNYYYESERSEEGREYSYLKTATDSTFIVILKAENRDDVLFITYQLDWENIKTIAVSNGGIEYLAKKIIENIPKEMIVS